MDKQKELAFDIELASRVQQLLLPKNPPLCKWCRTAVKNRMASKLGGDFFDFVAMPGDCQMLFIGDVTGHGLHASVVMALLYGYLHRAATRHCAPLETALEVNRFLLSFANRSGEFDFYFSTTLFCADLDPATLKMSYVNAGHVPPLVRRAGKIHRLDTTGPPLGFFAEPALTMGHFQFEAGDRLLLYTDGITETFNDEGHLFGQARLRSFLHRHTDGCAAFVDDLFDLLRTYDCGDSPNDDCTAIAIDFDHLPATLAGGAGGESESAPGDKGGMR